MGLRVAVVGATGAVGREMVGCLERRGFPVSELRPLASPRSAGTTVEFRGEAVAVQALAPGSFAGIDVALFSAGAAVSREFAPLAVKAGTTVVDNSSAFRMDAGVPLVVPEVNPRDLDPVRGRPAIVANPNCSTIQLVLVLRPLQTAAGLRRVVVSTYQSASGAGARAVAEMYDGARQVLGGTPARDVRPAIHPRALAFNCIPRIDVLLPDGSTKEEWKMVVESRKILGLPDLRLHATCVRVPVERGHSEAVQVELERPLSVEAARRVLSEAPGVHMSAGDDDFPTPAETAGTDAAYVGRLRQDPSVDHGLAMWVVADNLLKGAALNAVQIAERLLPA